MTLLWRTINCILNKKSKRKKLIPSVFKVDGNVITDPQSIAINFNEFFSEVGPPLASKIPSSTHSPFQFMNLSINENCHFHPVTEDEARETLCNLKDSCPGFDYIDGKLLISVQEHIVRPHIDI